MTQKTYYVPLIIRGCIASVVDARDRIIREVMLEQGYAILADASEGAGQLGDRLRGALVDRFPVAEDGALELEFRPEARGSGLSID